MFVLDTTTRSLEVLLDAAPATSQLPVVVTYADVAFGGATPYLPGSSNALTNGTTAVTACAAPPAATQRQVEELTVRNDDTAARVVTLRYNDNGTFRRIATATLQPGETLEYTHAAGLRAVADGAVKMAWAGTRIANGSGSVQVNADGSVTVAPATNVTSFKNGTSPQALRVYNTDTGGTADEWGALRWNGNVLEVGTYANGTGTARNLQLVGGKLTAFADGVGQLEIFNGYPMIGPGRRANWGDLLLGYNLRGVAGSDNYITPNTNSIGYTGLSMQANGAFLFLGAAGSTTAGASVTPATMLTLTPGVLDFMSATWPRNDPGRKSLTADATNATTTAANLSDLSVTVVAGRRYPGRLTLKCSNSTATGGIKIDFGGGTATATSFWAVASPAGTAGSGGAIVTGTLVGTTLTSAVNYTTITGETLLVIDFSLVVSAGGTFIPRVATNSAGTVTARLGSSLQLLDSPN